ncbi:YbbR domain-containing protein [Carnobacterium iners]|uniref:YbbR domain-containing protein n=1 Tax=Carnobacterium iners TaxID=1073423 RepID=A0A1X7MSQ8_9LACT|nr:CdaR family protein [Carnobacterium iners]SEL22145.1 YbbR domain-containing protein [Carnobacterium iners]SMH27066.1 YbbR domain-containing protein [Carnobacterium iners]
MEKLYNSPWFIRLTAFAFAILLFTYVNYENNSKVLTTNPLNGVSTSSSKIIANLPIVVDIDQEKYFVSGFPETASIEISGPTNIVSQTTASKAFDITAQNLDDLGVGTHRINLVAEGLSSDLNYTITPAEITIEIREKRVETFEIEVIFDESKLATGYLAEKPSLDYDTVEVSGAASTIEKINSVQTVVPLSENTNTNVKKTVSVNALDANGNQLDVVINPKEVTVSIEVNLNSKLLPIKLIKTGTPEIDYEYELGIEDEKNTSISVTGTPESLGNLSSFPLEIDVTGLTETATKEVSLPLAKGLSSIEPKKINVRITVKKKEKQQPSEADSTESSKESSMDSGNTESTSSSTIDSSTSENEAVKESNSTSGGKLDSSR